MNSNYLIRVNYHYQEGTKKYLWQSFFTRLTLWLIAFLIMLLPMIIMGLVGIYYLEFLILFCLILIFTGAITFHDFFLAKENGTCN